MDGHSLLLLQVVLSDRGLSQNLARAAPSRTSPIRLHNVRMTFTILSLMSDVHCHFQEKQQSDCEELIQVLKKEQDIYANLVKSLQDSNR